MTPRTIKKYIVNYSLINKITNKDENFIDWITAYNVPEATELFREKRPKATHIKIRLA